jgi:hypothetical protein
MKTEKKPDASVQERSSLHVLLGQNGAMPYISVHGPMHCLKREVKDVMHISIRCQVSTTVNMIGPKK